MKTIDWIMDLAAVITLLSCTVVLCVLIVDTAYDHAHCKDVSGTDARLPSVVQDCAYLYDVGRSREWAECMGIPYR